MGSEDDLLIAKVLDKKRICDSKNKITYTDFLNEREQLIVSKKLRLENAFFFGGNENATRKVLFFYPDKLNEDIARRALGSFLSVVRIVIPNENRGEYEHRVYMSAIIKIGIDRARIGDIIVCDDGADIVIFDVNKNFIIQGLSELTRFRKAEIIGISIFDVREKEDSFEESSIIVASMRCDSIVAEIAGCSRSMACEYIEQEKVFVNYETVLKESKMINAGDVVTIRGKGKFVIDGFLRSTRNGRVVLRVKKFI